MMFYRRIVVTQIAEIFSFVLVCFYTEADCRATILASHVGNSNPAISAGGDWDNIQSGWTGTLEAVTGDLGVDAWKVADTSDRGFFLYEKDISISDRTLGDSVGWTLRANIHIIDGAEAPDGGIWLEYGASSRRFILTLGEQSDGDPVVLLPTMSSSGIIAGHSIALEGSGDGYHLYELKYDPLTNTTDFFVDGVERFSDYAGATLFPSTDQVAWGVGTATALANANYNLVELEFVPEPSTAVLIQTGILLWIRPRIR